MRGNSFLNHAARGTVIIALAQGVKPSAATPIQITNLEPFWPPITKGQSCGKTGRTRW